MVALAREARRAALYVRVSTERQGDNYSLGTQEEECRRFAAEQGYLVDDAHVYRETHTAVDLWERPELTRAREAMARGEFDALVCYDPDRFSRKQVHTALLLHFCEQAGVELKFAMFDFEQDATGQLLLNVRAYAAELEHEKIRERTIRGRRARAKSGKAHAGPRPLYGYHWNGDRTGLLIDEATAPVVRRIYREVGAGQSLRKVSEGLSRDGIPTPKGGSRWTHATLHDLLYHPSYTGKAVAFRFDTSRQTRKEQGRRVERPAEEQIPLPAGTVPPLVTEREAALARQRLAQHRVESSRRNRNPEAFLLRGGYLRCGCCGHLVSTVWMRHGSRPDDEARDRALYRIQRRSVGHHDCPTTQIEAKNLDREVWARVEDILLHPENIKDELARMLTDDPTAGDVAALGKQEAALERARANHLKAIGQTDDDDTRALILGQLADLNRQRQQLAAERDALLARRADWEAGQQRVRDLERWLEDVGLNMPRLTYQDKRDILAALQVRVILHPTSHAHRYEVYAAINPDAEPLPVRIADESLRTTSGSPTTTSGSSAGSSRGAPAGTPWSGGPTSSTPAATASSQPTNASRWAWSTRSSTT